MFIGEGQEWTDGEQQAWHKLDAFAPPEVCQRTGAHFDEASGTYVLKVFNANIEIHLGHREIHGTGDLCDLLLGKLPHYSRLSILWYLVQARDILPSGNLVNPRELDGGLIFISGSHILPLSKLAGSYGSNAAAFLKRGIALGGKCHYYGDASIVLYPFPRIPVLLMLWKKDEEFPARVELLLDDTCSQHLPSDIIWSTAMVSILVML